VTKKIEQQIEIDADAATVWRALSEGEEIKRWFTLDARVRPGAGGGIWMSFGENMEWETPIEVWEEGKHLRTGEGPQAVDYTIEARGGTTIVRLVHSGFADDTWEGELDSLNSGWAAFLANLKHYLERHRGEPREVAYYRHEAVPMSREEAFAKTLAALGFKGDKTEAGARIALNDFDGVVKVFAPPINLTMTVENHNDGWLMVEMEPGRDKTRPALWLSLYGDARSELATMQERVKQILDGAFG